MSDHDILLSDDEQYDDEETNRRRAAIVPGAGAAIGNPFPSGDEAMAAGTKFRSMPMGVRPSEELMIFAYPTLKDPPPASFKDRSGPAYRDSAASVGKHWINPQDVINPGDFPPALQKLAPEESIWCPRNLRAPPAFYPLEKSTRLVEGDVVQVAKQLTDCLRILSVHAIYNDAAGTASLLTAENVEMYLSLWKSPQAADGVLVELQRRKGDSIAFHRYSRCILDSAAGEAIAEPMDNVLYSKKVQRLLAMDIGEMQEQGNALMAIEIAHGLLMKDRMDATQLGLESLCLLTDPSKTGYVTALLTAHVVLFGSTNGVQIEEADVYMRHDKEGPHQEIKTTILHLVLDSKLGREDEEVDEIDKMEQDGATGMDMDQEHLVLLHNLALAVLSNSLGVIENSELFQNDPEDTKPPAKIRSNSASTEVTNKFFEENRSLLSTLIGELRQASETPHNATLSAKCLGSLFRASSEARERAKDAKSIVRAALEVGTRTHLKLETECKKVEQALQQQQQEQQDP